jgi:hypothetical protein
MREQLNSNPLLQVALIGVLLVCAGIFLMSSMGGGEEEESAGGATEATMSVDGGEASGTATSELGTGASGGSLPPATSAPPPPRPVVEAFEANRTVVLLFVRDGGIDDEMVRGSVQGLDALGGVSTFVIPAGRIARYVSITQGVAVDRVPALVVVRPDNLDGGIPVASVSYGFQSPESVVQAVVDAGYQGRTVDYHP